MLVFESPTAMQQYALDIRSKGLTIGFVPTMGALHQGHASLMDIARTQCDILVVSIYVNPLQFGANEDLDTYPCTPEADDAICEAHGVDVLFRPQTLYAPNHATTVSVSRLQNGLCGKSRPTHFDGVTTVVARLFGIVQPSLAVFGEKDFQQLAILRQMVEDLALPVRMIGGPIVREPDGLALSSRNTYLSSTNHARALSISRSLWSTQQAVQTGETDIQTLRSQIESQLDVDRIDYIEFVDANSLEPVTSIQPNIRLCIAVFVGSTRLIDNCALTEPSASTGEIHV